MSRSKVIFWIVVIGSLIAGVNQTLFATNVNLSDSLIINEFMAANKSGLIDEDGDTSDWVELYNNSSQPINLSGWSLTDNPDEPEKWPLPDITLGGHSYLLVYASGKNRVSTQAHAPLHTNFRLKQQGDYLALYNVLDQRFANVISPTFPLQFADVSYGRLWPEAEFNYIAAPTPGEANNSSQSWSGLVGPVTFNRPRGFYDTPFQLTLSTATPQATIHYTTDGSDYEFIELTNLGQTTVDASLMTFEGINFTFPANSVLSPGESVVLAGNADAFTERYPGVSIYGVYRGNLSNAGEMITLKSAGGQIITSVHYDDERGWPLSADGRGDSLVLIAPQQDPNNPKSWQASQQLHGSPGVYEIKQ